MNPRRGRDLPEKVKQQRGRVRGPEPMGDRRRRTAAPPVATAPTAAHKVAAHVHSSAQIAAGIPR